MFHLERIHTIHQTPYTIHHPQYTNLPYTKTWLVLTMFFFLIIERPDTQYTFILTLFLFHFTHQNNMEPLNLGKEQEEEEEDEPY